MKIKEFAEIFESDFPLSYAFDGDNPGILIGDAETEITGILTTCDTDEAVVNEACQKGANLILSHHPLMFRPLNKLTESVPEQRAVRAMIANGIAMYSAHTNLDAGVGGLNDCMAELLGMKNTFVVDVVAENAAGIHGFGRMCELENEISLRELMNRVIDVFGADGLRYAGKLDSKIRRIAVNTGGGAGIIDDCIALGCDVLVTGDIKYNGYRDAVENGMCIVDIMHYDSEHIAKKWFADYIASKGIDVPVYMSEANVNLIKAYNG